MANQFSNCDFFKLKKCKQTAQVRMQKRQSEELRSIRTLTELTNELNKKGFTRKQVEEGPILDYSRIDHHPPKETVTSPLFQ